MKYGKTRRDNNHPEVVKALEDHGVEWFDTSQHRGFGADGIAIFRGRMIFVEIKNGDLPKSKQVLTTSEKETRDRVIAAGGEYLVVTSAIDALTKLGTL